MTSFKYSLRFFACELLVLIFQLMALALLFFSGDELIITKEITFYAGLILVLFIGRRLLRRVSKGDNYIYLITELLVTIGIMTIYRLDKESGMKQGVWLVISIFAYFAVYSFLKLFRNPQKYFYLYIIVSYALFFLTLILGNRIKGAVNWINFGIISFQPAELTKILLVFTLASYYNNKDIAKIQGKDKYNSQVEKWGAYFISFLVYSYIGLLFLQRDLGMAVIFFIVLMTIQYVYEDDRKVLLMNTGVAAFGALLGVKLFNHVRVRIDAWLDPLKYVDGKGYQITQSQIAISEGGLFGTGVGLGYPYFIPAAETDFIFSSICEEMGLFMGVAIVLMFLILVYRGVKIGLMVKDKFLRILSIGLSAMLGFQVIIILGGVIKMIPMTGITLPFVSYGGSSLLMTYVLIAILQYVSDEAVEDNA
ncbi:MAG: FtsW/RodA/SpoVE family cell cycle protein [Tissierellia bacterium]|nr:FtsW/RodA/SpoVE family cell cycle protein [Tissierellia bacterium]